MLRAMIQLAPKGATTAKGGVAPSVDKLRALARFPKVDETVYVIERAPTGELGGTPREGNGETRWRFPFMQMPPRAAQAAPVFIRGKDKDGGVSPKLSTLQFTLREFLSVAFGGGEAAPVYRAALEVLGVLPSSSSQWDEFAGNSAE